MSARTGVAADGEAGGIGQALSAEIDQAGIGRARRVGNARPRREGRELLKACFDEEARQRQDEEIIALAQEEWERRRDAELAEGVVEDRGVGLAGSHDRAHGDRAEQLHRHRDAHR
mgnify:CR=1 FL=1